MTDQDHGPGVEWLAARAGVSPEELLHDGTALGRALEAAARDAVDLARRLMSTDPDGRRQAETEARALRARFDAAAADGPSPEERFAAKLTEAARLLRERAKDSPGPQ
ncbi:UNVERIFIED_CONTAM: hypothetical protein OHV15_05120 [Microbacterium sp. SLM126]